jgi:hypothetical protein
LCHAGGIDHEPVFGDFLDLHLESVPQLICQSVGNVASVFLELMQTLALMSEQGVVFWCKHGGTP